jgi:aminoacylase
MAVLCRRSLIVLLALAVVCSSTSRLSLAIPIFSEEEAAVLTRLQDYLRINTSQPTPDYPKVTSFLINQAQSIGLDYRVLQFAEKKPVILLTWKGSFDSGELGSVLLNSHTDVCPAETSKWTHGSFSADLDEEGRIYARGSQDMKSVGMQYLEAARNLKRAGFKPLRSVHLSFLPDEEIGSDDGAKRFYASSEFEQLNVGVVLDEGVSSPGADYRVFFGEKAIWRLVIKATGDPSHGSIMMKDTALENLRECLNRIASYRDLQLEKVTSGRAKVGDVVSIANVYFKAGTPSPTVSFDSIQFHMIRFSSLQFTAFNFN